MNSTKPNNPDRIDQLMVDAATQGLAPQEEVELRDAIERDPSLQFEKDAYELAATAAEVALAKPDSREALPTALRDRLVASAKQHAAQAQPGSALKLAGTPASRSTDTPKPAFTWTDGRAFGWYAAAAALIALVVVLGQQPTGTSTSDPVPTMTLAERYSELATDGDTVAASWAFNAGGENVKGEKVDERFAKATGEVIWNANQQTGYMKLAGLPKNNPTKEQYQLWIVDPTRDAEPIDGGVFDITKDGAVIVPIDAKLRSDSPAIFAITVEQPGGVVVSEGPLQVVAAVPSAG